MSVNPKLKYLHVSRYTTASQAYSTFFQNLGTSSTTGCLQVSY